VASGAWLLYPIVVHEWVLGVAQWTRPVHRPFSKADIARLDALVPQAAIALENVRIRAAMQRQAATDGLTGLWNHRKMQEILRDEMRRAARYHRPISILMMDVDSFKTFNDMYGHPQGDELLRQIAAILGTNVRTVDYVGRYGGEEFIVVLPETLKDDACRMAERIRCSVEEQACLIIDGNPIRRTISVGVAAYPEDALNPGELVQRADEALYRAKHAGKNCVIWA
jgi:diguanylate cyclase (GGDEF)-like protein